ncbi:hypothetical protein JCM6882_001105 [Rhodosporidiobolus microsporus]
MNTLHYFLSTLRPAPPPSPRASTSELPIPLPLPLDHRAGDGTSPLEIPLPPDEDELLGLSGEGGEGAQEEGERARPPSPPLPPLRRGSSRKGKARADVDDLGTVGVGVEDPLRDGETVRTELERGEGVEAAFLALGGGGGERGGGQLPTPPPSPSLGGPALALPSPASPSAVGVRNGTSPSPDAEKVLPLPSPSASPPSASPSPSFPLLTRLLSSSLPLLTAPLRLLLRPPLLLTNTLYLLLRRFLALFGLVEPERPGWNALLAPAGVAAGVGGAVKGALSTEEEGRGDPEKGEKGGEVLSRRNRILTVALTLSSSSKRSSAPPTRTPSPSPSPSPTSLTHPSSSSTIPRPLPPPPAPLKLAPKTLVLDLDETLIHSTSRPYKSRSGSGGRGGKGGAASGLKTRVVEVVLEGRSTVYTVYKRPWVDFFLRKVSSWYTVVIFTASLPEYADPVIDWLDGGDGRGGMVGGRLFRADCLTHNGSYVKDLAVVDPDLSRVCLVDNSPASYAVNQANGIPIEGWINDPTDECLLDLLPMLDSLRFTNDVRRVLGLRGFGRTGGGVAINAGGGGGGGGGRRK